MPKYQSAVAGQRISPLLLHQFKKNIKIPILGQEYFLPVTQTASIITADETQTQSIDMRSA
jgi:hypothetical protein